MNKNLILLEDWSIIYDENEKYTAPELIHFILHGRVYNHPKFNDGEWVQTSYICGFDTKTKAIITRSGSKYLLGQVNNEYEKIFPNAKNRILKSLIAPHSEEN